MEKINLEWFFKLPGLFITGGVLLILIAILVYIIGSKKERSVAKDEANNTIDTKSAEEENKTENVVTPLINPSIITENINNNVSVDEKKILNTVENNNEVSKNETPVVFEPQITPIEPVKVLSEEITPVVPEIKQEESLNNNENLSTVTPIITPIEPNIVTPVEPVKNEERVETNIIPPIEANVQNESNVGTLDEIKPEEVKTEINMEPVNIVPLENDVINPKEEKNISVENTPIKQEDNIEEI